MYLKILLTYYSITGGRNQYGTKSLIMGETISAAGLISEQCANRNRVFEQLHNFRPNLSACSAQIKIAAFFSAEHNTSERETWNLENYLLRSFAATWLCRHNICFGLNLFAPAHYNIEYRCCTVYKDILLV